MLVLCVRVDEQVSIIERRAGDVSSLNLLLDGVYSVEPESTLPVFDIIEAWLQWSVVLSHKSTRTQTVWKMTHTLLKFVGVGGGRWVANTICA